MHRHLRNYMESVITAHAGGVSVVNHLVRITRAQDFTDNFGTGQTDAANNPIFRGWELQVIESPSERDAGGLRTDYIGRARAYWSIHDGGANELDFWDHIENVRDGFNAVERPAYFNGVYRVGPADITTADELELANVWHLHAVVIIPFVNST